MTPLVQIVAKGGEYSPDAWTPWQNAEGMSARALALLAVQKHLKDLRENATLETEPFMLDVYVVTSKDVRHPNGRPATCHGLKVCVTPEQ